jgi:hypothetical protein
MPKTRSKRRTRKTKNLSLKNAAQALAKLISRQEEERDRDIAQFERAIRKKLKRLRPTKRRT